MATESTEERPAGNGGTPKKAKDIREVMEKVRDLAKLAERDDSEEARNAAVKAIKLLRQHEIVMIPKHELEKMASKVNGAIEAERKINEQKTMNIVMGFVGGLLVGGKKLF